MRRLREHALVVAAVVLLAVLRHFFPHLEDVLFVPAVIVSGVIIVVGIAIRLYRWHRRPPNDASPRPR